MPALAMNNPFHIPRRYPSAEKLQELRRRFFLRRCEKVLVDEALYHGSPLEGLEEIRRCGAIHPQSHGLLPGEWFCVSTNDNMLRSFSEGEGVNGLAFYPKDPIKCLKLDWMHLSLCAENGEFADEWLEKNPEEEELAYRLGYECFQRKGLGMTEKEFRDLLPDWVEGVIFPWGIYPHNWNSEAEIALTEKGCRKIWKQIDMISVRDQWHPPGYGWKKIKRIAARERAEENEGLPYPAHFGEALMAISA